jgi:nitroreductase
MENKEAPIIDIIRKRVSCRTYSAKPIEAHKIDQLKAFLQSNQTGPFGSILRFELLDLDEVEKAEVRKLGTYGVIRDGRYYIAGTAVQDSYYLPDFGYAMERNILQAATMGLGTCWLGGTFNRAGFARRMQIQGNEIVPAITPVGYPMDQKSMLERLFRLSIGADKRKPWRELFFEGRIEYPLSTHAAGSYAEAIECVRLAPSAANRQPWRILKEAYKPIFHFLLKRSPGYDILWGISLQDVDMGIALCHFEMAANAAGLKGRWSANYSLSAKDGMEHITTWMGMESL